MIAAFPSLEYPSGVGLDIYEYNHPYPYRIPYAITCSKKNLTPVST